MGVVSRRTWKAHDPKKAIPISHPIRFVLDTDTQTRTCLDFESCCNEVRNVQINDMFIQHKHMDIRYSFIIGGDGEIYEGRGWAHQAMVPARYRNAGKNALLIAFMGHYSCYSYIPKCMLAAWNALIDYGLRYHYIDRDYHREQLFRSSNYVI